MAEKKSSLRKYLDTKKKPSKVLGPVERMLLARPQEDRPTDVLHPSEIVKNSWCPREGWFLLKGDTKLEDKPSLTLSSVFAEGHAIHKKWQGWLREANLLIEDEVPISYAGFRIVGNADGLLGFPNVDEMTELALLEIKSIGLGTLRVNGFDIQGGLGYSFRLISKPFPTHVRQAMLYAWCLNKIMPMPIAYLVFIYECKEDQSAKEFVVQYDEEYLQGLFPKLLMLFPNEDGVLVDEPPACINDEKCPCRSY
jgi:hypothetical protein